MIKYVPLAAFQAWGDAVTRAEMQMRPVPGPDGREVVGGGLQYGRLCVRFVDGMESIFALEPRPRTTWPTYEEQAEWYIHPRTGEPDKA